MLAPRPHRSLRRFFAEPRDELTRRAARERSGIRNTSFEAAARSSAATSGKPTRSAGSAARSPSGEFLRAARPSPVTRRVTVGHRDRAQGAAGVLRAGRRTPHPGLAGPPDSAHPVGPGRRGAAWRHETAGLPARLLHELAVGRGDGSYTRLLTRLAKLDLLAIDDWMLAPLRDTERRDLTEVIEDRAERASTLIASQLPVTDWHAVIGDPNQADAICDRLLHDAHRIDMKGRSMRRTHDAPAGGRKETT